MKERPIIFSSESIRAILDGKKSQTRRVVKPQPDKTKVISQIDTDLWAIDKDGKSIDVGVEFLKCPYGQPGTKLWIREAWRIESFMEGEPLLFGYKDGRRMEESEYSDTLDYEKWYERVCIQSTEDAKRVCGNGIVRQEKDSGYYRWDIGKSPCRWRSPLFMPRWASRITLEITEVRVERLREISDSDCQAEGCQYPQWQGSHTSWKGAYKALWESLNAKKYPWSSNPWVWCISFRRVDDGTG